MNSSHVSKVSVEETLTQLEETYGYDNPGAIYERILEDLYEESVDREMIRLFFETFPEYINNPEYPDFFLSSLSCGDIEFIEFLFSLGFTIDFEVDRPLHHLCQCMENKGTLATLEYLIRKGAPIDSLDEDGHTPLMVALLEDHFEFGLVLLANGADPSKLHDDGDMDFFEVTKNMEKLYSMTCDMEKEPDVE